MASVAITIELPDGLAKEADAEGLLAPAAVAALIRQDLRRKAAARIRAGAELGSADGEAAMSLMDLQKIVDEVRAEKA